MAVTVNIYYTGTGGNARKFVKEMISGGVVGEIRKEEGNIRYEYFIPVDDEETVLLIDSWKDQQVLDRHYQPKTMFALKKVVRKECRRLQALYPPYQAA